MAIDKSKLGAETAAKAEEIHARLRMQHEARYKPRPRRLPRKRLVIAGQVVDNRPPAERGETA